MVLVASNNNTDILSLYKNGGFVLLIEYNNKEFYTSKDLALSVIGGRWKIAIVYHLYKISA